MKAVDAAATLRAAREERRTITRFTGAYPTVDEQWGYDVQGFDRKQRVDAGQYVIGAKLGLTSAAKQQRMNVNQPIVGFLTHTMQVDADSLPGAMVAWAQPRIEPEIAFVTSRPISSPLTMNETTKHIEAVTVAAEIIDSRYTGFKFELPDVVADNTSAAGFIVGPLSKVNDLDLSRVQCQVEVDHQIVHKATGDAILGHPLRAMEWLSRHLAHHGQTLPEGSLILAGALTDAVPLISGRRYAIHMGGLGSLTATV